MGSVDHMTDMRLACFHFFMVSEIRTLKNGSIGLDAYFFTYLFF